MKLTLLFAAKIAASLVVFAKAVNGEEECPLAAWLQVPALTESFPSIVPTYNYLLDEEGSNEACFFAYVVYVAITVEESVFDLKPYEDPASSFLNTCLQDVVTGLQQQVAGATESDIVCADDKTKVNPHSEVIGMLHPEWNHFEIWNLFICKSPSCDSTVLNTVLNSIYITYASFNCDEDEDCWTDGHTATATYTPTTECLTKQIQDPLEDPELYCSGDNAPVCSNTKLLEITLGDDDPFEVAVCDDNDCFDSVEEIDDLVPIFVSGLNPRNTFCIPEESYRGEFTEVFAEWSTKDFNLVDYCSVAATSGRTGMCKMPKSSKKTWSKSAKSSKASKKSKSAKSSKASKKSKSAKSSKAVRRKKLRAA